MNRNGEAAREKNNGWVNHKVHKEKRVSFSRFCALCVLSG